MGQRLKWRSRRSSRSLRRPLRNGRAILSPSVQVSLGPIALGCWPAGFGIATRSLQHDALPSSASFGVGRHYDPCPRRCSSSRWSQCQKFAVDACSNTVGVLGTSFTERHRDRYFRNYRAHIGKSRHIIINTNTRSSCRQRRRAIIRTMSANSAEYTGKRSTDWQRVVASQRRAVGDRNKVYDGHHSSHHF